MRFPTFDNIPKNEANAAVNTQLSLIASGRNIGNILLFGDVGCGKTAMANLIPLWFSTAKGYPSGYLNFHDCTRGLSASATLDFAQTMCTTPSGVDFMILDEIDKLPAAGQINTLLTPMTINPDQKIFILTANNIHKIPESVQSRCLALHIKAPTPIEVLPYVMRRIQSNGGIADRQLVLNTLEQVAKVRIDCRDYERVIKMYSP